MKVRPDSVILIRASDKLQSKKFLIYNEKLYHSGFSDEASDATGDYS